MCRQVAKTTRRDLPQLKASRPIGHGVRELLALRRFGNLHLLSPDLLDPTGRLHHYCVVDPYVTLSFQMDVALMAFQRLRRVLFCTAVACPFLLSPASAETTPPEWIWSDKQAQQSVPGGNCYFRRMFTIPRVKSAELSITADNRYIAYLNGRRIGGDDDWQSTEKYDVTKLLEEGDNVLAIECHNEGASPAGLAAKLTWQAADDKVDALSTDTSWRFSKEVASNWNQPDFDDSGWSAAVAIGVFGRTPPWGAAPVAALAEPVRRSRTGPFELLDGDRVALLGNTLFEREQSFGYWEHELTRRNPDKHVTFRNLGWSGDRPSGISRKRFGKVDEGFAHLSKSLKLVQPTVVLVNYGANAAHEGESGSKQFFAELDRLFDVLEESDARLVLVSPIEHEHLGKPLPNPAEYNQNVRALRDAMREYAEKRDCQFADLIEHFDRASTSSNRPAEPAETWTNNGIHLSPYGYWQSAPEFAESLGVPSPDRWVVEIAANGPGMTATGAMVHGALVPEGGQGTIVSFAATDLMLPRPDMPAYSPEQADKRAAARLLRVTGLKPGNYQLSIGNHKIVAASAEEWARGVAIESGPSFDQSKKLLAAIRKKNELFFHRYRPQNETYLFLFRKHEQGNNAVEIPQFDPLVEEQEQRIAELRQPQTHTYRIERVEE